MTERLDEDLKNFRNITIVITDKIYIDLLFLQEPQIANKPAEKLEIHQLLSGIIADFTGSVRTVSLILGSTGIRFSYDRSKDYFI